LVLQDVLAYYKLISNKMGDTTVLIMEGELVTIIFLCKDVGSRLDVIRDPCIMEFSHIDNFILKVQIYITVVFGFGMLVVYHG